MRIALRLISLACSSATSVAAEKLDPWVADGSFSTVGPSPVFRPLGLRFALTSVECIELRTRRVEFAPVAGGS